MSLYDVWQLVFDFLPKKAVCVEPVDENLSTDAGLLVFRQWDEQQQFTEGFAEQLDDPQRDPISMDRVTSANQPFGETFECLVPAHADWTTIYGSARQLRACWIAGITWSRRFTKDRSRN